MEWFISTMQNSSVALYPLLLFCLAKFPRIIRTASTFFVPFFFFFWFSWAVEFYLQNQGLFWVFFSLSSSWMLYCRRSILLFPIFLHTGAHRTRTFTTLSPPPSLSHPRLVRTLRILLQKLVFKNLPCDFALTLSVDVLNVRNKPFA